MSEHDQRFKDWLPAYALGALDGDELEALERHLESGCSKCEAELAGWNREVEEIAASVEPVEPSETTRARVLGRASSPHRRPAGGTFLRLALAASLSALMVGGWLHLGLSREVAELERQRLATADRLERLEGRLGAASSELARLRLVSGIVASPGKRLVALAGLTEPGEAFGQALVDPAGRRAVFYAYGLRPTEAGKTYQLWFIADGRPVSAGIFDVDDEGRAMLLVEEVAPVESIEAWAVTVEPAGGVPQPTGTMVLKG